MQEEIAPAQGLLIPKATSDEFIWAVCSACRRHLWWECAPQPESGRPGSGACPVAGTGASPEGNRPFLDLLNVESGETRRLWQSTPPFFEATMNLLNDLDDRPIR